MPNPNNRKRGEQWDLCQRCGRLFPMSALVLQKGSLICARKCFDNLTVERRNRDIEMLLGSGDNKESADLRMLDRAFFEGYDIL